MSSLPSHRRVLTRRRSVGLLAAAAIVLASCGSGGSSAKSEPDGPTTTVDTAILGTPNPATGPELKIGFIYDGQSEAVDNSADVVVARAAVDYVNEYMGGIAGHKVVLDECATDQTPAGGTDCATQMVTDDVPAVLIGLTGQAGTVMPPLAKAEIPTFVTSADPRDVGATILTNGIVALAAGPASVFVDAGVKRAAVIGIDVPAAAAALQTSVKLFYEKAGLDVDLVLISPDTADMTPNIQAALTKDPGGMTIVGDPLFCTKAMSAIASSGFDGTLVVINQCFNDAFVEATTNLEGAVMLTTATSAPDSKEYQLYKAIAAKYAPKDVNLAATSPSAYQAVIGFARAMNGFTGDVTTESVAQQLADMSEQPMPLMDGITFRCDGKQVTISPAICSQDVLETTLDAKGAPTEFTILRGGDLLELN